MTPSFQIAIDGTTASGKGTLAKALARHFGLAHLDTGLLYRAVGSLALETGQSPAVVAQNLRARDIERDDLRTEAVAAMASQVAAIPEVRAALLNFQRAFAAAPPAPLIGAVLDGRDIGTVILPEAPIKLFITADDETRARRRHQELLGRGENVTLDQVLADLRARDARDSSRAVAPTRAAADAQIIDTSTLSAHEVFDIAEALVRAAGLQPEMIGSSSGS